ncbi:hypothetical protein NDA18_000297 [Ustilago nuda]|nr:hypothetical protein NDA18_000297 [Ustilago nuda]
MAKGIPKVAFPEPATQGSLDEVKQGLEALIPQGHKGRLDAGIDRRELRPWAAGVGKVVDGAEAGGVGLWYCANGRANEGGWVGDPRELTLSKASGNLLVDMGQPSGVHGEVAGGPANRTQWALVANAYPMSDATQQLEMHLSIRVARQEAPPSMGVFLH